MQHAITVGDLLWPAAIFLGVLGLLSVLVAIVWLFLFNPFRSGH